MQKRHIINYIALFVLLGISGSSAAQYMFSVGAGGSNEMEHDAYGSHVRLYYNFSDNARIGTEFVRFFHVEEKNEEETFGYDYREINLTGSYIALFGDSKRFGLYGMLGFTYSYGRRVTTNATDTSEKFIERAGVTAGFGLSYKLGRFTPYWESRSVTAGSEFYLVHSLGLTYSFGKRDD